MEKFIKVLSTFGCLIFSIITGIILAIIAALYWPCIVIKQAPQISLISQEQTKEQKRITDGVFELYKLKIKYLEAKKMGDKSKIRREVLARFALFPKEHLPTELQEFYFQLAGFAWYDRPSKLPKEDHLYHEPA